MKYLPTYLPVWPDLAKFRHFFKVFVHSEFAKILNLPWQILLLLATFSIAVIGYILLE